MSEPYALAISGLLKRRQELQDEAATMRERMASVQTDVEAIDRVLDSLGYQGKLENRTARSERIVLFYRNKLRSFILKELRGSERPLSTRELAEAHLWRRRPLSARQAAPERCCEAHEQGPADDAGWQAGRGRGL
ncbi:hypothetical protein [Methylobacterium brachiatum]|uniref:hypothetical protein n=1 Tax=Methylobacterium brachiatum TaxID=269660 RepID=UPI000EFBB45F|nr:hypothetical protein [Methylobacterium brachiatum]AYO82112.1 hypothetical protein EBB05_07505 [Methylobacterium brachiatum]